MTGAVRPLGPETAHYWRVQRMARATGVDLVAAWKAERFDHAAWKRIVTRCRGCAWAEGCQRWLDRPTESVRRLPQTCLNRERLEQLGAEVGELAARLNGPADPQG